MIPVFVWWIGEEEEDTLLMDSIRGAVARAFSEPALAWRGPERPHHALDARRRQWSSGAILEWLGGAGPGVGKVLGVTDRDLFIPILTYVFGEAQLGGAAAVVSTARLREGGDALLVERLVKEAVHELGHTFGLVHCGTERCVMSRSPSTREVDEKLPELCPECRERLEDRPEGD